MCQITKNKRTSILLWLVKITVFLAAVYLVIKLTFYHNDIPQIKTYLSGVFSNKTKLLYFLPLFLLLMFINWSSEVLKWMFLIKKIGDISFPRAFKAVVSGITISLFTPNRTGEFAGRVIYLPIQHRIKGAIVTIIGSISQLVITIVAGTIALLFFFIFHVHQLNNIYLISIFSCLVILFIFLILSFYLNFPLIYSFLTRFSFVNKFKKHTDAFALYSSKELLHVLKISFLRYFVFSLQLFLLMYFFEVHVSIAEGLVFIPLSFFTIAAIPSIAVSELGIRELTGLYFFGILSSNHIGIVAAFFSLWLINIILPAIAGAFFILCIKVTTK